MVGDYRSLTILKVWNAHQHTILFCWSGLRWLSGRLWVLTDGPGCTGGPAVSFGGGSRNTVQSSPLDKVDSSAKTMSRPLLS